MPCTKSMFVPTGGAPNVVSVLPSTSTVSEGERLLTSRNVLAESGLPVLRPTLSGPLILTRHPSHGSAVGAEIAAIQLSSWVDPTWNAGTRFPEFFFQTTMSLVLWIPSGPSI